MRLIDVDALDDAFTALRWRGDELLHWGDRPNWCLIGEEVEKLIADAPTIDAIPVDWIFEQMQILHELHNKNEYVLQWLMEMWQKEQEVQDG